MSQLNSCEFFNTFLIQLIKTKFHEAISTSKWLLPILKSFVALRTFSRGVYEGQQIAASVS